jgi:hypothetical protein
MDRYPINRLAARIEHSVGQSGQVVVLTADEVQTALGVIRSHVEQTANASADHLFRVERVDADGVVEELAAANDAIIARVAYDAAERPAGGRVILRCGSQQICSSAAVRH